MGEVLTGQLSVRQVFMFVERLYDEPWSRFRAKVLGGEHWREHLGWGPGEYLDAILIDAVRTNTAVTNAHGSGRRPRAQEPIPRPGVRTDEPTTATLADLPIDQIENEINNNN